MKNKLAIFDLDGTILDTLEDLAGSLNYALATEGYPGRTLEEVRRFVGNGMLNLVKTALTEPFLQGEESQKAQIQLEAADIEAVAQRVVALLKVHVPHLFFLLFQHYH